MFGVEGHDVPQDLAENVRDLPDDPKDSEGSLSEIGRN